MLLKQRPAEDSPAGYLISDAHLISDIYLTSNVCLISDVCLIPDVCLISDVRLIFDVCLISDVPMAVTRGFLGSSRPLGGPGPGEFFPSKFLRFALGYPQGNKGSLGSFKIGPLI